MGLGGRFKGPQQVQSITPNVFQLSEASINSYDISFMYKLPRYNWNIVENDIKHHNHNHQFHQDKKYEEVLAIWRYFYF
jgi:hypothetical protein